MIEDLPQSKSVVTETSTVTKRAEGESASLSFSGSKHLSKWIMTAVALMLANLGYNVASGILPPKGEQARQEAKASSAIAVGRNDDDNKRILSFLASEKDQLDSIIVMKTDVETLKVDVRDLKSDVHDMNHRFDDFIISTKK